jgi:hypothetical protein
VSRSVRGLRNNQVESLWRKGAQVKIPPATTTGASATQHSKRGETTAAGVEKLATAGGETTGPGAGALPVDSFEKSAPSSFGALLGGRSIWSGDFASALQALPDPVDTPSTNVPPATGEHERATIPLDRTGNPVAATPAPVDFATARVNLQDELQQAVVALLGQISPMLPGGTSPAALPDLIDAINHGFSALIQSAQRGFDELLSLASTAAEREQLSQDAASYLDGLQSQRDAMLAEVEKLSEQGKV